MQRGPTVNWQTIDLATMIFPAELRFDYVRIFQIKNIGCDSSAYPTADYGGACSPVRINNRIEAYMSEWRVPLFSSCGMLMEGARRECDNVAMAYAKE
jgi:hypothetical protein